MKSIDTIRLRIMLGWLGLLLPWIVLFFCIVYDEVPYHLVPNSISETYYYHTTITPFMIILGSAGLLLMCYKGYTKTDDILNTITGIMALGVCLFPCMPEWHLWADGDPVDMMVGTFQLPYQTSSLLHNGCAIIFFVLLSINCLFLFTKSSGAMTKKKKIRNIIYRVCGIGMLVAIIVLAIGVITGADIHGLVWFVEAIALMFFGIAFLTKADVYPWLFCDPKEEK